MSPTRASKKSWKRSTKAKTGEIMLPLPTKDILTVNGLLTMQIRGETNVPWASGSQTVWARKSCQRKDQDSTQSIVIPAYIFALFWEIRYSTAKSFSEYIIYTTQHITSFAQHLCYQIISKNVRYCGMMSSCKSSLSDGSVIFLIFIQPAWVNRIWRVFNHHLQIFFGGFQGPDNCHASA